MACRSGGASMMLASSGSLFMISTDMTNKIMT
ncbi:MAG: hypothetical protein HUJ51_04885 [Eggerthellaceae bacterium]|nr:hypothetical protein [Eggerthellaceae bacterium]